MRSIPRFGDGERPTRCRHIFVSSFSLHCAREFHQPLSLDQRESLSAQRVGTQEIGAVDRQTMRPKSRESIDDVAYFGGPAAAHRQSVLGGIEKRMDGHGSYFGDRRQGWIVRQAILVRVFEQHGAALGGNEAVAAHVVQQPDRHVAAVRGVANVDRVDRERGGGNRSP